MKLRAVPSRLKVPPTRVGNPPKMVDPFYHLPEWRRLAGLAKHRAGYRCRMCGWDPVYKASELIADHIVERADGGAEFDWANVQVLCIAHHNTKTADAKIQRIVNT